ncbi:hypothetical protein [Streptomyces wuyuanensis]
MSRTWTTPELRQTFLREVHLASPDQLGSVLDRWERVAALPRDR